jgi:hypothetical protein
MSNLTYSHLDYDSISKEYRLSVRDIIKWFSSREDLIEGLGAIEGGGNKYKDNPRELLVLLGQVVPVIIANDPRKLYEFFDDRDIRISIASHPDSTDDESNETPKFTYYNSVTKESRTAKYRGEAETNAFIDAFKLLEKRINGSKEEEKV